MTDFFTSCKDLTCVRCFHFGGVDDSLFFRDQESLASDTSKSQKGHVHFNSISKIDYLSIFSVLSIGIYSSTLPHPFWHTKKVPLSCLYSLSHSFATVICTGSSRSFRQAERCGVLVMGSGGWLRCVEQTSYNMDAT